MHTAFMKNGPRYTPVVAADNVGKLPPGNFVIKIDPEDGHFFFEEVEPFKIPKRLYGEVRKQATRILATFESRENSTGALLSGDPGSGKTLLAKILAAECAEKGMPTIIIDRAFSGGKAEPGTNPIDKFYKLIQDVQQPAVVFLDEFEKTHTKEQQESMLTLLDGVFQGRKLWLMTCNDEYAIDSHMLNRPGRLFYHLGFTGMPAEAIREYCEENLKAQEHIQRIVQMAGFFESFNFDMLQALVEEMNRFNEDPFEAVKMLNIRPRSSSVEHHVSVVHAGVAVDDNRQHPRFIRGSPIGEDRIVVRFSVDKRAAVLDDDFGGYDGGDDVKWQTVVIRQTNLKRTDLDKGLFEYKVGDTTVIFRKDQAPPFNYKSYISM